MREAGGNGRSITAEGVQKIVGAPEVTPQIRLLADLLSAGRANAQVTGPEFERSEGARSAADKLLDHLEQEMEWNAQLARKSPQLHESCQEYHWKLRNIADAITSLNDTELLHRAAWASQRPQLRMRNLVASHVFLILVESGGASLTFPASENARVTKVTTELLRATVEPGAEEATVRQTIKRLKHGEPVRTKKR
jgi:hypothetical protein